MPNTLASNRSSLLLTLSILSACVIVYMIIIIYLSGIYMPQNTTQHIRFSRRITPKNCFGGDGPFYPAPRFYQTSIHMCHMHYQSITLTIPPIPPPPPCRMGTTIDLCRSGWVHIDQWSRDDRPDPPRSRPQTRAAGPSLTLTPTALASPWVATCTA